MKTNNTLDENTIKLLKSFIGKKLIELKHDPIIFSYTSYGVVYLNISKNIYSITDFYENLNYFDENNDISVLKINSNIKEVKARGASLVLFIKKALAEQLKEDYHVVLLPDLEDKFMVFPAAVALQLLAYYVSSDKGFDVDKPRNLAKVVTVE